MAPQVPTWFELAKPMLDAKVPDHVYDAQRDQYFQTYVLPAALKAGENTERARENFYKASERPDKSSMPRAALVGASALKGLVAPLRIVMDPETGDSFAAGLESMQKDTAVEAARQGINPTLYAAGGEMLGQAPMWIGGMAAAKPLMAAAAPELMSIGLSETAARVAAEALAGSAIQGAYDYAKADEGHRLQEGLKGAALGGAMVGAIGALGPLRRALMTRNGLSEEVATSVENAAKGVASPTDETIAGNIYQAKPEVTQTIEQWLGEQIKAAKKAGLPKDAVFIEPGGRAKIQLKTADGKIYNVGGAVGVDVSNIGVLVDRLSPHLDAGGEILSVNADPVVANRLYSQFDRINTGKGMYEAAETPAPSVGDLEVKNLGRKFGQGVEAGPVGQSPEAPSPPEAAPTPSTGSATTAEVKPETVTYDGEEWTKMPGEFSGWWSTETGRTLPEKALMSKLADAELANGAKAARRMSEAAPGERAGIANAPEMRSAERPLGDRLVVDSLEDDVAAYTKVKPGRKPFYVFSKPDTDPSTIFHETLHGHLGTLGLTEDLRILPQVDKAWKKQMMQMSFAWPREIQAAYLKEGAVGEEVYAYAASAVRTNDAEMISAFAEADSGRQQVMKWVAETTDTLLESTSKLPDSVHKRVLERKLGEVMRRSTGELRTATADTAAVFGADVDIVNGRYVVKTPEGVYHRFAEREDLAKFLEEGYGEPLSAPNLIDESLLPADVPRYARNIPPYSIGRPPVQTPPPTMEGPRAEQAGASLLSFFTRPFYPWLDSVSRKLGRPDLYEAFKGLDVGITQRDAMMVRFEKPLKESLVGKSLAETKYSPARQQDLYRYMSAVGPNKTFVEQQLHITPAEKADLASFERNFIDPLTAEGAVDLRKFLTEVAPIIRQTGDPERIAVSGSLTQADVDFWKKAIYQGEIDPLDTNLLRLSHSYLRLVARDKTIGGNLALAKKLIDEKAPGGENFRVGTFRPLLQRQLDYIAGRPDYTQRVVDGAVQGAMNLINSGIEQVNKVLPGKFKIEPMDEVPRDVMGRWILFSYAGGLALRPMVPIRDSMQLFLTTYPMLGGKYVAKGMAKAFPVLKEGVESDAYRVADAYGALMKTSDMQNLYSGGYESLASGSKTVGTMTRFAEAALKPLQWSNNSNRLIAFHGHAEQVMDALKKWVPGQNAKMLEKESGLFWLDDTLKQKYVQEAMNANAGQWQDLAYRAAKELTDISQWNYRRGASPGIYKYAMGRLFGQYGTWPLNYIEYARRLVSKGDAGDKAAALARLAIAHGAVLKAGEAMGVDTGQWVFTQPMAYGGSPLFQAVVNVPNTMDFESYRGMDARRDVARIFWPMQVPGGLAAERIYKAVTSNSQTALQEALGFAPLKPGEVDSKLYHQLIP